MATFIATRASVCASRGSFRNLSRLLLNSGPIRPKLRGAGGLRNPALAGRPGPEATLASIAFQLGTRLTVIGQHYDSIDEFVRVAGYYVAAAVPARRLAMQPLAEARIRRDHRVMHRSSEGGAA